MSKAQVKRKTGCPKELIRGAWIEAKATETFKAIVIGAPASKLEFAKEFGADLSINIEEISDSKERVASVKKESPGGYYFNRSVFINLVRICGMNHQ